MPVSDNINRIQVLSGDKMVITESGYLEVFAYNDAQTPVFFDNIELRHTSGPVLEENHYYPFGMLMDMSYMPVAVNERNFYKYGRKELQTEHNLNWGDHENRMSDYTAGRWWVVDPLAEDYYDWSPYNYCFNNPLLFVDPDGMGPFNKLPYNGSAWDYLKTIPNFATDIVNSVADLFFGGVGVLNTLVTEGVVPAAQDLSNGLVNGIGGGIYNRIEAGIDYHLHTPVVDQLKDAVSPQMFENTLALAIPVVAGTATVNVGKGAATNVAKGTAKNTVAETTTSAAKGGTTEVTTVGRWMSKREYAAMKSGTTVLEGAGGQTFVTQGGSHLFSGAARGSVYAEFQVPTNSLLQGGKQGWFKMLGPNASKSQQYLLQKQGGPLLPQYQNLSPILKTK
ncbi:MAG: hypothetical protein LBQ60_16115 [Bacteroidales bacterium]|nr:hypothetical protein [Bacteroidales bacterium]